MGSASIRLSFLGFRFSFECSFGLGITTAKFLKEVHIKVKFDFVNHNLFLQKVDQFHADFGSFGNDPMQSCSVRRVVLSLASVYSSPSDSFDHRNFISCKDMHLYP